MPNALTSMPTQLRAGTTLSVLLSLSDFPADQGWTVTLKLGSITQAATASGSSHQLTVPATSTDDLPAGAAPWLLLATKGSEAWEAGSGVVEVLPVAPTLSYAEQALAAIRAMRAGTATLTQRTFQIEGRAVEHYSDADLRAREQEFQERVAQERRGNAWPEPVQLQFGPQD